MELTDQAFVSGCNGQVGATIYGFDVDETDSRTSEASAMSRITESRFGDAGQVGPEQVTATAGEGLDRARSATVRSRMPAGR